MGGSQMRVSIVTDDDLIVVDGEPRKVDLGALRGEGVHAIQWYGDEGEIEWKGDHKHREPNLAIFNTDRFQYYIDRWLVAETLNKLPVVPSNDN
jgi:hypothetical protein